MSAGQTQLILSGAVDWAKRLEIGFDTTNNHAVVQPHWWANSYRNLLLCPLGGSVGIGTGSADPICPLEIRSDETFTVGSSLSAGQTQLVLCGATNSDKRLEIGFDTTNNNGIIQPHWRTVAYRNLLLCPLGGNVGIGKTPNAPLDVNGAIVTTTSSGLYLNGSLGTTRIYYDGASMVVTNGTGGVFMAANGTSWTAVSDRRLKCNINYTSIGGLDVINGLKPCHFNYKTDEKDQPCRVGFIAQEVNDVLPEAVAEYQSGYMGVSSTDIIPSLVRAIQELSAKIDALT